MIQAVDFAWSVMKRCEGACDYPPGKSEYLLVSQMHYCADAVKFLKFGHFIDFKYFLEMSVEIFDINVLNDVNLLNSSQLVLLGWFAIRHDHWMTLKRTV